MQGAQGGAVPRVAARGHGRASLSYLFVDEAVEHAHQETLPEKEQDQITAVDFVFSPKVLWLLLPWS